MPEKNCAACLGTGNSEAYLEQREWLQKELTEIQEKAEFVAHDTTMVDSILRELED